MLYICIYLISFFQSLLQLQDQTASVLCSPSDVPDGGFNNQIPMVMRGNCTFYEKVRLAQINGARGLLIVSRERLVSCFLSSCAADTPLMLDTVLSSLHIAGI